MLRHYITIFRVFRIILSSSVHISLIYTYICVRHIECILVINYIWAYETYTFVISPAMCMSYDIGTWNSIYFLRMEISCVEQTVWMSDALKHCLGRRSKVLLLSEEHELCFICSYISGFHIEYSVCHTKSPYRTRFVLSGQINVSFENYLIYKFGWLTKSTAYMPTEFLEQKTQNHLAAFTPLEIIFWDIFIFFRNV